MSQDIHLDRYQRKTNLSAGKQRRRLYQHAFSRELSHHSRPTARHSTHLIAIVLRTSLPDIAPRASLPEVDEYGTITEADFKDPETNREIFDISVDRLTTTDDIISEIEDCAALVWHFRRLASDKHDDLIRRIELRDYHDDKQLQAMRRLAKALEDEDDGWKRWIEIEGNDGVRRFKEKIVGWLAAPIEWGEDRHFEIQQNYVRALGHGQLAAPLAVLSRENLEIAAPLKPPLQHIEVIVIVFDVEHFGGRRFSSCLTALPVTF